MLKTNRMFLPLLVNNDFIKNVISLLSGNLLAQVITLAVSPLITRLFTPENFGTLTLFTAIVMILSQVGSLCYERAILLPKYDQDGINIFFLSLLILLVTTVIVGGICFSYNHSISSFLNNTEMSLWILFLPIGVFVSGAYKIYRFWLLRKKQFKVISVSRVIQSVVAAGIKIVFGVLVGAVSGWLVGSFIIGFFVALVYVCWFSDDIIFNQLSYKRVKSLAVEYKQFPMFASWNALINFASQNMVVFMLSIYFTPAIVGFYNLGNRLLRQPIITLSESVQNVYFQKSAQQVAINSSIKNGFVKTTLVLFLIGIIPFSVFLLFGKKMFILFFGGEWAIAGSFVQIMTPWFFILFFSSPGNVVFEVCNKQEIRLKINVIKGLFRFFGLFFGCVYFKDPFITLGIFVVICTIFELITLLVAFSLANNS